jgi:hypothetical protein
MPKQKPIYRVDTADYAVIKTNPTQLEITATGTTKAARWHNFELELRENTFVNGVYEFDFTGLLPVDPSPQVLTPTGNVTYTFKKIPADLNKIIIHAESNKIELKYPKK